ncbi:unnamed protein product [Coregonus sp. 'balchen']|nr:unnamed protein product [Coregonus sp. 'balchen']
MRSHPVRGPQTKRILQRLPMKSLEQRDTRGAASPVRSCASWTRSPSPSTSRRPPRRSSSRRRWRRCPTRPCCSPWRYRSSEARWPSTSHPHPLTGYGMASGVPPHLELKARPKLGEREVTLAHVTDWIEKKLDQEFQKIFVMPNMDDLWLTIMHSAMDPRSFGTPSTSTADTTQRETEPSEAEGGATNGI